jgi:GNAT superfamily N-acetyltransferase
VLDYLTCHPDFRNKGVASLLVGAGAKAADSLGLASGVIAMRIGLGVYQRAGFVLIDSIIQDASAQGGEKEYGTYFLLREVNDRSVSS